MQPITSPEQFAGRALLKIGRAKTHDELDTLAWEINLASKPAEGQDEADISQAQYAALVAAGVQRRAELGERQS